MSTSTLGTVPRPRQGRRRHGCVAFQRLPARHLRRTHGYAIPRGRVRRTCPATQTLQGTPHSAPSLASQLNCLFLTTATQAAYPLVTGGKPILALFAMLVILYEMTMLASVIATVIGIIIESRLPNVKPGAYDPRITEGWIGVVVTSDDDMAGQGIRYADRCRCTRD